MKKYRVFMYFPEKKISFASFDDLFEAKKYCEDISKMYPRFCFSLEEIEVENK